MGWLKNLFIIASIFFVSCASVGVDGGAAYKGYNMRLVGMTKEHIGAFVSYGQESLPQRWRDKFHMDRVDRYGFGGLFQTTIYKGLYFEPRGDIAYYPGLGTPWEFEFGIRLGYKYRGFGIYVGARHPMGNGDRHEANGDWEHIPDGWKPEFGISYTWTW